MRHLMRRREYERINQMLDDAIAGRFEESDYDESELSKLEVKWKRYLTSSKLSAVVIFSTFVQLGAPRLKSW